MCLAHRDVADMDAAAINWVGAEIKRPSITNAVGGALPRVWEQSIVF